jgi:hypothetical protein
MQRPAPTFEEIQEGVSFYKVKRRINNLRIEFESSDIQSEKARDYFQYGVMRRLPIISINLCAIFDIAYSGRTSPLDLLGESSCLSMHLHSFFYHCYGALDNAAWSFAYEKRFILETDDWRSKKSNIGFWKKDYSAWLKKDHTALWNVISSQQEANKRMKDIRDAIAHRIPLYVPSFITQEQREEQTQLYQKAAQAEPLSEEYFSVREQADTMGFFKPLFFVEGDLYPQYHVRIAPLETATFILSILEAVNDKLRANQPLK